MKKFFKSIWAYFFVTKEEKLEAMKTKTVDVNVKSESDKVVVADGVFPIELSDSNVSEVVDMQKEYKENTTATIDFSHNGNSELIQAKDQVEKIEVKGGTTTGNHKDIAKKNVKEKAKKSSRKAVKQNLNTKYNPNVKRGANGRFQSKKK